MKSKKCYLVVSRIDNVLYLELTDDSSISAYESLDAAVEKFDSFKKKAMSCSYESFVSGSMGILSVSPHIIEVDAEDPAILGQYLVDDKVVQVSGKLIGAFVNFRAARVKEDILQLSVYDVSKEIIKEVYEK